MGDETLARRHTEGKWVFIGPFFLGASLACLADFGIRSYLSRREQTPRVYSWAGLTKAGEGITALTPEPPAGSDPTSVPWFLILRAKALNFVSERSCGQERVMIVQSGEDYHLASYDPKTRRFEAGGDTFDLRKGNVLVFAGESIRQFEIDQGCLAEMLRPIYTRYIQPRTEGREPARDQCPPHPHEVLTAALEKILRDHRDIAEALAGGPNK